MPSPATTPSERTRGSAVKLQYALARLLTVAELAATNPSPQLFAALEQEIGKSRALLARAASAPIEPTSVNDHAARCALNLQYTLARVVGTAALFAANPGHDTLLALEHEVMCGRAILGAQDFRPPATHQRTEPSGCQRRAENEALNPRSAKAMMAVSDRLASLASSVLQGARRLGTLLVPEIPPALLADGAHAPITLTAPSAAVAPESAPSQCPASVAAPAVLAPSAATPSILARSGSSTPTSARPTPPTQTAASSRLAPARVGSAGSAPSTAPAPGRPAQPPRTASGGEDVGAFRWPSVNAEAWRARAAMQARLENTHAAPARPHPLGPRRVEPESRIGATRPAYPVRVANGDSRPGGSDTWRRPSIDVGMSRAPAFVS